MVLKAASLLHGTGLFEPDEIEEFDLYNEYKRGCPRFRSSSWIYPPSTLVILADKMYCLNPISKNVLSRDEAPSNPSYSSQIMDLIPPTEIHRLPIPKLPVLLVGLCRRFLDSHDDVALIAAEQLVDGMDLDEGWCERNLSTISSDVLDIANRLVAGKASRLDDFSENTITCFIANKYEAERVRGIPGYE